MQARPEVTVRDPSRVPGAVDAAPPRARQHTGALVAAGTALLLAFIIPLGQGVPAAVSLSLTERFEVASRPSAEPSPGSVLVSVDLALRNSGPRPVTVGAASVGELRSTSRVELAPGGTAAVRLVRTVSCPADGTEPGLDPPDGLRVQVLATGRDRDVVLPPGDAPLARLRAATRRACGFPPLGEAVELMAFAAGASDGEHAVTLLLSNTSRRRVHVVQARPTAGLRLVSGPRLPHQLSRTPLGARPSSERLQLTVAPDCASAPRSADGSLAALPAAPLQVRVAEAGADGGLGRAVGPLRPRAGYLTLLREAYRDACA